MITEPEYLEELEKLEEGKKNKAPSVAAKSRKRGNIQSKSTKKKKKRKETFSSSSSEESGTDFSYVSSKENVSGRENLSFDEELDDEEILKNFWASLSPPACKSDNLNKWFAFMYQLCSISLLENRLKNFCIMKMVQLLLLALIA